jgi:hypothetical protein
MSELPLPRHSREIQYQLQLEYEFHDGGIDDDVIVTSHGEVERKLR